ncbi:hypothetical protein H1R20_g6075, partial [Candolleomyces eurysporus]
MMFALKATQSRHIVEMYFTLDDGLHTISAQYPQSSPGQSQVKLYESPPGLSLGNHKLVIKHMGPNDGNAHFVRLDSVLVGGHDMDSLKNDISQLQAQTARLESQKADLRTAAIVLASLLGAILILCIYLLAQVYMLRRRSSTEGGDMKRSSGSIRPEGSLSEQIQDGKDPQVKETDRQRDEATTDSSLPGGDGRSG